MANIFAPGHEISNNEICATSKGSDQPAHTRSLIRAFASRYMYLNEVPVFTTLKNSLLMVDEPGHEISKNEICATSTGSDQPAHMRSLIRAFASRYMYLHAVPVFTTLK